MVDRLPVSRPKMYSSPRRDLHTLPTATQLTQPVTACARPLVSYAGPVEQMTWLTRKSHRSSAQSTEQGRNGARPNHSPGAVVPYAGAAEVGPPEGGAGGSGGPAPATDPQGPPDARDSQGPPGTQGPPDTQGTQGPRRPGYRAPDSHDSGSADSADEDSADEDSAERRPRDTAERQSAMRAAAENTAFRAASRNVWPGTEDRHAQAAPSAPRPAPPAP